MYQIIHKYDDFLFTLFPELRGKQDQEVIIALEKYYTYSVFKPKVLIENGWIKIDIDTPAIISQESDYRKTVALCSKGKYSEAKPILKGLIEKNPTNSEYHRIMGQIFSEEGNQEDAIDSLIDALRWDSKNGWALLMMGNILAKFKKDISTAMKYYDQAMLVNPDDHIAVCNIGALLMQQGEIEKGKKYLNEAMRISSDYPNTYHALGRIAEIENDLHAAFSNYVRAMQLNTNRDELYHNSVSKTFEVAKQIINTGIGRKIVKEYKHKLEFEGSTDIEVKEDVNISTAAKFELAENYQREKHIVRFKPNYPAVEHLVMHELVHLKFIYEARKAEMNHLFVATQAHFKDFLKGIGSTVKLLGKRGISDDLINKYCTGIFEGINSQVYNAPIDLFIEDFLYNEYVELRPFQFLSLFGLIQEGINAVTDKNVVDVSPKDVLSKSKIFNLLNALHFKTIYGLDIIKDFNPTPAELQQAKSFYEEYLQYRDNREPGEEYELVLHWAEDLKLDKNFELILESDFRNKRTNPGSFLDSIEKDPYDLETRNPFEERQMEKFIKSHENEDLNMAVVMFMVDALNFFESKSTEDIKKIAHEIAFQGVQGYSPKRMDYTLNLIPDKTFSGNHILAYYYVSWSLAIPEMVPQLKLPFENEYAFAVKMYRQGS